MINIVKGDLLDAREDIIAHQVNCMGSMGSGVALQIKEKWPQVYKWYKKRCDIMKDMHMEEKLLGDCHWCQVEGKWIVNMFGQYEFASRGKKGKRYTDYDALRNCLEYVRKHAMDYHESLAMPYGIGCGRGGGDWEGVVYPMICDIFEGTGVNVTLYQKE